MVKLTFNALGWMFEHGVDRLRRAYEESCRTFYLASEQAHADWTEHQRLVAAGAADTIERDEYGNVEWDYGDHIGAIISEADSGLGLVTEAFTMALHHYWEKQLRRMMKAERYVEREAFDWLTANGLVPRQSELTELRLAANCIKHDDGHLARKRPDLFDLADVVPGMKTGWHAALKLQPRHLEAFFVAVRESGPQKKSIFPAT
ncbi:MAG TPA: hypothetical protein VEZ20_05075 [Allosphingosinicella sp.]|jgi:hypothetical protein|nr:hypothetical protein [Allosphingosinicella sp.]